MCVCVCLYAPTCSCECTCAFTCVWRLKVNAGCLSQSLPILCVDSARYLLSQQTRSSCPHLPRSGDVDKLPYPAIHIGTGALTSLPNSYTGSTLSPGSSPPSGVRLLFLRGCKITRSTNTAEVPTMPGAHLALKMH